MPALGLASLDQEIGKSELLLSVAPVRLVSVGGSLAVCLLRNRDSSWDIDCILDPNIAAVEEFAEDFQAAVQAVSDRGGFEESWLNRGLETFIHSPKRMPLFLESIEQGLSIYSGKNLCVFAGRLDWALERKVRRIAHTRRHEQGKDVDLTDAVALLKRMVDMAGRPLTFESVRALNYNGFDVEPTRDALVRIAKSYRATYGSDGLIEE